MTTHEAAVWLSVLSAWMPLLWQAVLRSSERGARLCRGSPLRAAQRWQALVRGMVRGNWKSCLAVCAPAGWLHLALIKGVPLDSVALKVGLGTVAAGGAVILGASGFVLITLLMGFRPAAASALDRTVGRLVDLREG